LARRNKKDDTFVIYKAPTTTFVAVAFGEGGMVPYFDEASYFEFYSYDNGKRVRKNMLSIPDKRLDSVIDMLVQMETDVLICRGYSPRAMHALKDTDMECCLFDGGPHAAIKTWASGKKLKKMKIEGTPVED